MLKVYLQYAYRNTLNTFDLRKRIHFLHIGKNAGTQIGHLIEQLNRGGLDRLIVKRRHFVRLRDLPKADPYFFSIRSPETRFVSAFYSRKRKGQPRIYSEWTDYERRAFLEFEHANDLAESLFADGAAGRMALSAIKSISHCSMDQVSWFDRTGFFLDVRPPVHIIRQENLVEDIEALASALDYKKELSFARDRTVRHANDYSATPELSGKALENIRRWYVQDSEFYKICSAWIASRPDRPASRGG